VVPNVRPWVVFPGAARLPVHQDMGQADGGYQIPHQVAAGFDLGRGDLVAAVFFALPLPACDAGEITGELDVVFYRLSESYLALFKLGPALTLNPPMRTAVCELAQLDSSVSRNDGASPRWVSTSSQFRRWNSAD
jgi:hypothetical protein